MSRSPVELRVGSTGAGLFVGCGVGLGIVTPVSLHSVPVLGQLAASLATSLGSLNHATGLGGLTSAARRRVQSLGVRGLDLGFGCGVILGYGWGAGLMLKPTALQSLTGALQSAGQQVAARLPPPMQAALQRHQQQPGGAAAPASGLPGLEQQQSILQGATPSHSSSSATGTSPAALHRQQETERELAELSRLVLKQQNQLGDLQEQLAGLQAAVCRLDASAPGCKKAQ